MNLLYLPGALDQNSNGGSSPRNRSEAGGGVIRPVSPVCQRTHRRGAKAAFPQEPPGSAARAGSTAAASPQRCPAAQALQRLRGPCCPFCNCRRLCSALLPVSACSQPGLAVGPARLFNEQVISFLPKEKLLSVAGYPQSKRIGT